MEELEVYDVPVRMTYRCGRKIALIVFAKRDLEADEFEI